MQSLKLGFGSNDLTMPEVSIENVTSFFVHPAYNKKLKHHDIALVKLPKPINETGLCLEIVIHFSTLTRSNFTFL